MGNAAGGLEQMEGREGRSSTSGGITPTPTLRKKTAAPPKLPMPAEEELEERFNVVLVSLCVHDMTFTLDVVVKCTCTLCMLY